MIENRDLWGHSLTNRCFFCSTEAITNLIEVRLPHPNDPDWLDVATGKAELVDHGIVITAASCEEHYGALADAFLDHVGSASGWSIPVDPPCPHPFHEREGAHPPEETVYRDLGNGWQSESYRCPECGFATMSERTHVGEDDPAYIYATRILEGGVVKRV